jgi:hypothetical protein
MFIMGYILKELMFIFQRNVHFNLLIIIFAANLTEVNTGDNTKK